jgi:N-acetylmuramoyl-L-alanine amidase
MSALRPKYIVVHTAAYNGRNCDRDMIDQWHRERGWNGIGYHYTVINDKHDTFEDGTVQTGRDLTIAGAHARGINNRSIGICCIGHGDQEPFTDRQNESLIRLVSGLIDQYEDLKVDNVIGHRELNALVAKGVLRKEYTTTKTCPGKKVHMVALREQIRKHREMPELEHKPRELTQADKDEVIAALNVLEGTAAELFPNARGELREFLTHPEVMVFRS